ncbi:hypothetical protein [Amaricoccus solimangrovi]|uniref:Cytochrome c domain-containing protein n=1 Tax=Amaricoccus solimangrovi TaxID=2589815 RepID=A0A501WLG5_9RHOB|nr:hypothetical protein [Amaricoccus solimangrovi]TPE49245.1 hypothetical protein FJM51_15290 [Amaricoccus solimangrovi]
MWPERITRIIGWILAVLAGLALFVLIVGFFAVRGFVEPDSGSFGTLPDEAKQAGRDAESLRAAGEPYFAAMDKGLLEMPAAGAPYPPEIEQVAKIAGLEPEAVRLAAIRGQNMWIAWTGGNDRFWDWAARNAIGSFDLLKIISSHPSQAYGRGNRFRYLGLSNEPCFRAPDGPDDTHFGLWIDQRDPACPPDPFADADAYPGVKVGARGETLPVGSYYGEPTGVMGLRLFPNPDFDAAAKARWDPERFYKDPAYYNDKDLVRPYRVGMSCAFCHVGPSPIHPPKDVENPAFGELASNTGAQYFWVDRIFFWNTRPREDPAVASPNEGNILYQLFHTNPPGALDTSLVSTDYMNNPRTMNAVYETIARLDMAPGQGIETLRRGELDNRQFQDYPETAALGALFDPATGKAASMRVLKDGADSVGALGALNRVYLNIGLFSEEWLLHFRAFLGGRKISPIPIATARKNSVYWRATEAGTPDMAIFFLVTARADRLRDAPGGAEILAAEDKDQVKRGEIVFAETCAGCHSSKQPVPDPSFGVDTGPCAGGGSGPGYRACWDRYWAWVNSDGYKAAMREMVARPDFLDGNFLSTDRRVPLDLIGVNACSAIATNGLAGDIWDNFTSATYKSLPAPKPVTVYHPVSGGATEFAPLGNGRGYVRPASLVSLWSTAPYLQNNSVGYDPDYYHYDRPAAGYGAEKPESAKPAAYDPGAADDWGPRTCPSSDPYDPAMPCVENRLHAFDRSIRQILDPAERRTDPLTTEPVPGYIYRTSAPACLIVPPGFVPDAARPFTGLAHRLAPWAVTAEGGIAVGPFPKDFPINALVSTKLLPDNDEPDMMAHLWKLAKTGPSILAAVKALGGQCAPEQLRDPGVEQHAEEVVRETGLVDTLVGLSKCPDYVVNRGHDFGAPLSPDDREALIAYLRHF